MASVDQLRSALRKADAAGDTAAATRFARMIQAAQGKQGPGPAAIPANPADMAANPATIPAITAQTAADAPELSWTEVGQQAIGNVPESGKRFFMDMWNAVRHPIDTGKTLYEVADGAVRLLVPGGDSDNEDKARALGQMFAERYGTIKGFKHAVATDPVSILADVAGILSGGGASGARLPGLAGQASRAVATVGKAIDPTTLPLRAAGRVLNPNIRPEVTRLMEAGVTPTPGQILGGVAKSTEDKLMSVPMLGDVIGAGRRRAIGDLNAAGYNRALEPIGKSATAARGAEGVARVSDQLAEAYSAVMPKLHLLPDDTLINDIVNVVEKAKKVLTDDAAKHLDKLVDSLVMEHLGKSVDGVAGDQLKAMLSDLGKTSERMSGSAMSSERTVGGAISDIGAAIQKGLERGNPQHAETLRNIDRGYANYVRIRAAGKMAGADQPPGFSASQLRSAVSATDKSVGKGDTARGRSLMQDLSRDATDVLGYGVPDSGTTGRALMALAVGGGYALDPTVGAAGALTALPYLPGGQGLAATLLARRAPSVRAVGRAATAVPQVVPQATYRAGRLERDLRERSPIPIRR
jgi:hypothetical protein